MLYRFDFQPYCRQFQQPLKTSHGIWEAREGIIIRLMAETGIVGFGEIAPLSWFGSESFPEALEFCGQLPSEITTDDVFAIPSKFPACQFGFESAWEEVTSYLQVSKLTAAKSVSFSGLLPSGKKALDAWEILWNQGYRTFKWKIGIGTLAEELNVFDKLAQVLPAETKLRLDANGGLSFFAAVEWLKAGDRIGIEFLEQPLPATEFDPMLHLSKEYSTIIALDESVASIAQLQACYEKGWRGIFVIKPAIAGSPKMLRQLCYNHEIDAVFSTVFETPIGNRFALKLSAELSRTNRAAGFGVAHWFPNQDFLSEAETNKFIPDARCHLTHEDIWNYLSKS
ncbi:MAG: o-succinylbenzoate synthase [Gloeotrichia echinulata IR180]|jgi:O-succinylbenzoate synthase